MSNKRAKSNKHFDSVPRAEIQRSSFNRTSSLKTTFASGYLNPMFADEVLPGDSFTLRMHNFVRMATPQVPIMDDVWLDSHFFFVPNRLLWDNWQKFNGEQEDPGDSTDFTIPQINPPTDNNGWAEGSIADFMGIPTGIDAPVNALHHRACNLIWNEFFRDQNLQDSVLVDTGDAASASEDYNLMRRGKTHDYFTSALPFPSKGPAVQIPLGQTAPVIGNGLDIGLEDGVLNAYMTASGGGVLGTDINLSVGNIQFSTADDDAGLVTDLSAATSATINQLREAFQIQKLYERDARGGTRYTEILRSHFGVTSPDQRLQRPEYLGGGSQQINFNPVSHTTGQLGEQGAYVTSSGGNHSFSKSFTEHGVIIGFVSIRAQLTYQEGLDRMWSRETRWDYYWPALAHIGEQAILEKEIMWDPADTPEAVWGYQERFGEYRFKPSRITNKMRSWPDGSLDIWHLAQDFGGVVPPLNATFIQDNPPIDRLLAVPGSDQWLGDFLFELTCVRPMPTYGVPGLIDHF